MKIQGLSNITDFTNKIESKRKKLNREVSTIVKKAGLITVKEAKINAPKDTGQLRNSIISEYSEENGKYTANVTVGAEHGIYNEFGTGERGAETNNNKEQAVSYTKEKNGKPYLGMKATPFFYPAVYNAREVYKKDMKEVLKGF